jgi:hypothetical protein
MSDVFLLAKEEARYRQPTDVQEPKASYAAVLIGRCTGAETVACRCSNTKAETTKREGRLQQSLGF